MNNTRQYDAHFISEIDQAKLEEETENHVCARTSTKFGRCRVWVTSGDGASSPGP
jgi:hypothetical protein